MEATRRQRLYSPQTFLYARGGSTVRAHLNLGHKFRVHGLKTWSVKDSVGAKTVGHVRAVVIEDASFTVNPRGNLLVRERGKKTVHAWVAGRLVRHALVRRVGREVRYNPHAGMTQFMRQDAQGRWTIPVSGARRVYLTDDWRVYAVGIQDVDG